MSMSLHWLPNAISLLRIALVAPILWLVVDDQFGLALALFWLAGFSDGLDGYLAKRFHWHTRLGALLDPIADKLLVSGLFITLAATGDVPVWLAAAVILRDVVIVLGATAYNFLVGPVHGSPTTISKINTALQLLFLLFVLARAGFGWPDQITITILGAATFVTVIISGANYVVTWARLALERKQQNGD